MNIFSNFINENDAIWNCLKSLNKPITLFYDYIPQTKKQLEINPYNFIILHEPNEFFGMHDWVKNNYYLFTGILTWNQDILNACENSILFYHSANNYDLNYINKFKTLNKKFEVSFLCGTKNLVEGHKLRQEIYKLENQITIPKKWFYVLEDFDVEKYNKTGVGRPEQKIAAIGKKILFDESMFSIVIENVNKNNWFTEKLSDALNTKTVPIYWGCPNISELGYDERGIIKFNNISELLTILENLNEQTYHNLKNYIDFNYEIAKNEITFIEKLKLFFTDFYKLNNI